MIDASMFVTSSVSEPAPLFFPTNSRRLAAVLSRQLFGYVSLQLLASFLLFNYVLYTIIK